MTIFRRNFYFIIIKILIAIKHRIEQVFDREICSTIFKQQKKKLKICFFIQSFIMSTKYYEVYLFKSNIENYNKKEKQNNNFFRLFVNNVYNTKNI